MKKIVSLVLAVIMSITIFVSVFANGEISVYLDDEKVQFDVAPLLVNGRTMVPLRAIFEKLGATVNWDNNTQTAIADKGDVNVKISIDDTTLYKNGKAITLDVPAQLKGGRTLVPLRAVSEAFDCVVFWNGDTQTIRILSAESFIDPPKNIRIVGQENGAVYIQWDKVDGAEYYHFYYKEDSESNFWHDVDEQTGEKLKMFYDEEYTTKYWGLEKDKKYNIKVTSVKNGVESQDSEVFTFVATTTSLKDESVNKLRSWVMSNSNYEIEGHKLYEYKQGNYRLSITPNIDGKNLSIGYIEFKAEGTTSVSVNLLTTRFMGSYTDDINDTFNVSAGDIVKSSVSDSLELTCDYYEGDYTGNKNTLIGKYQDSVNITLKLFDNFLKTNYVGLTLKDFELNFDISSVVLNNSQTTTSTTPPSNNNQNNTNNNYYQGGGNYSTNTKITITSFPLYLYADDGTGKFLGEISSNKYDTDSIANEYGDYGNKYNPESIFNQYGNYGNKYSQYSVFNEYATNPPKILDKNGKVVGYLTANKYIRDAISYEEMMVLLKKFRK